MNAISLFSGVGGFEIGFERAGIQTLLQAEQDKWCLEVLARHWPDTERVTDVRQVDAASLQGRCRNMVSVGAGSDAEWMGTARGRRVSAASVDLVYGGFPCQDVSVAGLRAGLSGERSGLWHEFLRVLRELRPRWCVIENVPGLLSSNSGRDFATILLGLGELGYGWAYRILDARWFGVPQRRRRVFVVGCLGDARRAAQVLAVCESCGGHPQTRPEAGQRVAASPAPGAHASGFNGRDADNGNLIAAATQSSGGHPGSNMPGRHKEDDVNLVISDPPAYALPITNRQGIGNPDVQNFLVAGALRASDGHHGHSSPRGDGADNLIAFDWQSSNSSREYIVRKGDYAGSNRTTRVDAISYAQGVRRLTPLECERLMGFPGNWTSHTSDGREIPDSHRYRMCGNGVVATVAEWIGHRLVAVS